MRLLLIMTSVLLVGCQSLSVTGSSDDLSCSDIRTASESIQKLEYHKYAMVDRPDKSIELLNAMVPDVRSWALANSASDKDSVDMLLRQMAEECVIWARAKGHNSANKASLHAWETTKRRRGLGS